MGDKLRPKRLVSVGGLVCRADEGKIELVICGRKEPRIWALPKGTPAPNETREETAIREVGEETGLEVEIRSFVRSIDYWFVRPTDRLRCHKTVHFYLMGALGGDTSRHDHEFDEVKWVPVEEALSTLTYPGEVQVVKDGISMVPGTATG